MNCRICGNAANNLSYTVKEMMFGTGDQFSFFQCSRCDCLQISEIPEDMSGYYPEDYYSFSLDPRKKYRNRIISRIRRFGDYYTVMNRGILGKLISNTSPNKKLLPLSKVKLTIQSKILDVGCGTGWRLYALKEAGFHGVLGIDPYLKETITYENGLTIFRKSIHQLEGKAEWDIIMYHHSFEHLPDPVENLSSASMLLKPGGTCLLRIPTVSSFAWEQYREHWFQIDAPRHFFLHSVESIRLLAERTGFRLERIVYDSSVDQFRDSELYKRGIPLRSRQAKGFFSDAQIQKWKREANRLNKAGRGDQAIFYLVKK